MRRGAGLEDNMDDDEDEMRQLRNAKNHPKTTPKAPQKSEPTPPVARSEEDDLLMKMNLPTSFGRKEVKESPEEMLAKTARMPGPQRPGPQKPGPQKPGPQREAPKQGEDGPQPIIIDNSKKEEEDDDDDDMVGPSVSLFQKEQEQDQVFTDEEQNFYKIPYSHEAVLKGHLKGISCLALDPSGSRLLTGSHDGNVKMWDFAGMSADLRSFRSIEPWEGALIKSLQYTNTGDRFLLAATSAQARIYSRDGFMLGECLRGDMYIIDMTNTKGHVANLGNAVWSPTEKDIFMTSGADSTIRIWDVEKIQFTQKTVIKLKTAQGHKTAVNYCNYSKDGKSIFGGCEDGSIQVFGVKGQYSRPSLAIREAHMGEITGMAFHEDGVTIASRAMDDTMKLWDIRQTKQPVAVFSDLMNYGNTNCSFSPDGNLLFTGTCVKRGEGTGLLVFYDKTLRKRVKQIGIEKGASVVATLWHPKINQIVVGTSASKAHVFYNPELSKNGALLSVTRAARVPDPNDYEPPHEVHTPSGPTIWIENPHLKRRELSSRFDPRKHAKLEPSQIENGPGRNGRLGSSVTQYLMQNYIRKDTSRDEDPREALLKYDQEAKENPYWFAAYQKTQPEPKFDYSEEPELVPRPKSLGGASTPEQRVDKDKLKKK
jgi:WD40 repeat protein